MTVLNFQGFLLFATLAYASWVRSGPPYGKLAGRFGEVTSVPGPHLRASAVAMPSACQSLSLRSPHVPFAP